MTRRPATPAPVATVRRAGAAGLRPLAARIRAELHYPLYTNVYALTLNTAVTLVLGALYWVVAARLYPPEAFGAGAAIISTMILLSSLSQLNLNGALARFLPESGRHGGRLIGYAYAASCGAAVLLGGAFLLALPGVADRLAMRSAGPLVALAFVASVAAWGVFTLQDTVLTAVRGAVWVPVKNTAYGVAKILLLVPLAALLPSLGIFASWTIPVVAAIVPVSLLVSRRLLPAPRRLRVAPALPDTGGLVRFVTLDYVGYLFRQVATNGLPVLVAAVLGVAANAVFYVGWLVGTSIGLVADHFGMSLTVESAAQPSRLATYTRQVLRKGLLLFGPGSIVLCLLAPVLLLPFGAQYAANSSGVLRLFALAVIPRFVVSVFVAACRVQRRIGRIVVAEAAAAGMVVALSVATMPPLGVVGVGVAYLLAHLVVAAAVTPTLVRLVRSAS